MDTDNLDVQASLAWEGDQEHWPSPTRMGFNVQAGMAGGGGGNLSLFMQVIYCPLSFFGRVFFAVVRHELIVDRTRRHVHLFFVQSR